MTEKTEREMLDELRKLLKKLGAGRDDAKRR